MTEPARLKDIPAITVRDSNDRKSVVILFGPEDEEQYYGVLSPQQALHLAERIRKRANAILQIKDEVQH